MSSWNRFDVNLFSATLRSRCKMQRFILFWSASSMYSRLCKYAMPRATSDAKWSKGSPHRKSFWRIGNKRTRRTSQNYTEVPTIGFNCRSRKLSQVTVPVQIDKTKYCTLTLNNCCRDPFGAHSSTRQVRSSPQQAPTKFTIFLPHKYCKQKLVTHVIILKIGNKITQYFCSNRVPERCSEENFRAEIFHIVFSHFKHCLHCGSPPERP